MKKYLKKMIAVASAFAVAFTAVAAMNVTTAKAADYETVYQSSALETATAGVEQKYPIEVSKSGAYYFTLYTAEPVEYTITVYNSTGNVLDVEGKPYTVTATNSSWKYSDALGAYVFDDGPIKLNTGDYTYAIKFSSDTQYLFQIDQEVEAAKISQTKATITAGFTTKLSVTGAKVKSWSSSKKTIATVDSKGKVTGKKAGKATITAKLDNGKTVKCTVTVKANKYSSSKPTTSDVSIGNAAMKVFSASYDAKGNLVLKARYVNNAAYKTSALEKIKITVKDGNGKLVGTYTQSKKTVSVPSYATKDMSFTISKSKLKQKKVDLRNCTFSCDGQFVYYY